MTKNKIETNKTPKPVTRAQFLRVLRLLDACRDGYRNAAKVKAKTARGVWGGVARSERGDGDIAWFRMRAWGGVALYGRDYPLRAADGDFVCAPSTLLERGPWSNAHERFCREVLAVAKTAVKPAPKD